MEEFHFFIRRFNCHYIKWQEHNTCNSYSYTWASVTQELSIADGIKGFFIHPFFLTMNTGYTQSLSVLLLVMIQTGLLFR
jgi:hypothetical protein